MPTFKYTALTDSGQTVEGTMDAGNRNEVFERIVQMGHIPQDVSGSQLGASQSSSFNLAFTKVKPQELILFTKQFKTMFVAGISVIRCLEVLEEQTTNIKLKYTITTIINDVKQGDALHVAFSKHPKVFGHLYVSMMEAGEAAGALPDVMERLIYILEHEHKVKKDIQSALFYPAIVFTMLVGAFFFLLTFVIPQFVRLFERAHIDLPWPTLICLKLYAFLSSYWHILLFGTVASIFGLVSYLRTPNGKYMRDKFLLGIPIIGVVLLKGAMSRFASIFAILQASGVTVLNSVHIISGTIGNEAIAREFSKLKEKLEQGRGLSSPLKQSSYFPPMVTTMIGIGEETGNLDEMLKQISTHYDYEITYAINRMSELMGPILMCMLSGVVGFFAMAIFLPMWDLTKMVQ